jgi:uncharacterized protein (TIGR04255 family)
MQMEQKRYARPPITEAVIELRFEDSLTLRDMERVRDRFKSEFPTVESRQNIQVSIDKGKIQHKSSPAGFKMTAKNAVDLVLITPDFFITSRLAPYETWNHLLEHAKSNFEMFTKVLGRKIVKRIGTRFVNRIDIPNSILKGRPLNEFILLGISLSAEIATDIGGFSIVVNTVQRDTGAKLTIRSSLVDPALIDHTSITLDTDAYWDTDIPMRIDEMWAKTDMLRIAKNSVFENSMTDKTRELFK